MRAWLRRPGSAYTKYAHVYTYLCEFSWVKGHGSEKREKAWKLRLCVRARARAIWLRVALRFIALVLLSEAWRYFQRHSTRFPPLSSLVDLVDRQLDGQLTQAEREIRGNGKIDFVWDLWFSGLCTCIEV